MTADKGFKLVPVEPTEEMLEVLHSHVAIQVDTWERTADIINDKEWWAAVVAAAPTPPQPIYDEAKERELFEAWAPIKHSHYLKPFTRVDGKYAYTRDEVQQDWTVWKACAQSRAKAVEVGHE